MLKISDNDIDFAFKQMIGGYNQISWTDYLDLHNLSLKKFMAIQGVGGAEFRGPKGSEEFYQELRNFISVVEFGLSSIYSAMGERLPKVEERHLDEAFRKPYKQKEIAEIYKERSGILEENITSLQESAQLYMFSRYAVFLVLKSVLAAADEELG